MAVARNKFDRLSQKTTLVRCRCIHASERQFQRYPAGADGGRVGCNSRL